MIPSGLLLTLTGGRMSVRAGSLGMIRFLTGMVSLEMRDNRYRQQIYVATSDQLWNL